MNAQERLEYLKTSPTLPQVEASYGDNYGIQLSPSEAFDCGFEFAPRTIIYDRYDVFSDRRESNPSATVNPCRTFSEAERSLLEVILRKEGRI